MRRECSSCFGDPLQIGGSFDIWFGQERTCLMNIVDDAASIPRLHFEREETIVSAMELVSRVRRSKSFLCGRAQYVSS